MPRSLEDVASFYLPELPERELPEETRRPRRAALPIVTLPIAQRDAVRAAFAWNLTVELARLGARATLVVPQDAESAALWPEPGRGPLGAYAVRTPARDAGELARAALDRAVGDAVDAPDGGVVLVAVPPRWLCADDGVKPLWRRLLLWTTPDPSDLLEAYGLAKRALRCCDDPALGLVVHGVRQRAQAERLYAHLADVAARRLGRAPVSYGLLADDLHVYRAITARRPIGLEHPQSRAARALGDVAGMLWDDLEKLDVA